MQYLVIPKWYFPNNIGDSVVSTFLPRIIKHIHPDDKLTVITSHELLDIFSYIKEVDYIYKPSNDMLGVTEHQWASRDFKYSIFPLDYKEVFHLWNKRFDFFANHSTINKITLNYLYQNALEHLVDYDLNFRPEVNPKEPINNILIKDKIYIAIVPSDKLSGRASPHPGCNGIGYRLNGDDGRSWKELVSKIREEIPNSQIIEFGNGTPKFGDVCTNVPSIRELAWYASKMQLGIMADGGIHHIFNSQNTKVILHTYKIARTEFFKLSNSIEYNNENCIKDCSNNIKFMEQWSDVNKFCTGWCEKLSIDVLLELIKKNI